MLPPAQTLDTNVTEHLWAILENNISKNKISNKEDLKKALLAERQKISSDFTQKLLNSMQNRLQAIIKVKEYPTK